MKWSQVEQTTDFRFNLTGYECGAFKELTAVYDAMSYCLNFINRIQNALLPVRQLLKHFTNRCRMLQNFTNFSYFFFACRLMSQN
ncbi:hypothetical protein D3C77_729620 [compost metagenome]